MHALDQKEYVLRLDPKEMYRLTCEFPDQCELALGLAREATLPTLTGVGQVLLTGMGGSAVGGDFVKCLFEAEGKLPFQVNRDYVLPGWAGPETLVFASSYSGNTEETLAAYESARAAGAKRVVLTSGGQLAELARKNGDPLILIPAGQPPRTALGLLCIPVVAACEAMGLLPRQDFAAAFAGLRQVVQSYQIEVEFAENSAKQLAQSMQGKLSVLYGLGSWQAVVANRWKGQINENSKNMTFANAFPELNHNEILGWVRADGQGVQNWVCVVLQDGAESEKMKARDRVTLDLIRNVCPIQHHVQAEGDRLLERMLTLVLKGDFVSLYLAALNGVDPENIDWINVLKSELSKIPA